MFLSGLGLDRSRDFQKHYRGHLQIDEKRGEEQIAGLYVHFPFCEKKCPYCHFYSIPFEDELARLWLEGIKKEAALHAEKNLVFDTIYIGGGTPSLIKPRDLERLRKGLEKYLRLSPEEFTLEVNPGLQSSGVLKDWGGLGVNRISIGVQSFDDRVLRTLERSYTSVEAMSFFERLRNEGFENINIDLMIGVPGEDKSNAQNILDKVETLRPDHVSLYILENIEGLPFEAIVRKNPVDDDWVADEYLDLTRGLKALGFSHYEISNFALEGKECLHNLKYWRYEPFVGLGPSACSHLGNSRWCNTENLVSWRESLEGKGELKTEVIELGPEDALKEAVIFGLRLVGGIRPSELLRKYGIDIRIHYADVIAELLNENLLIVDKDVIRIPEDKLLVSNQILSHFI